MAATAPNPPVNQPVLTADGQLSLAWVHFFQAVARQSVDFRNLPTVAPPAGSGIVWNSAGTVKVA